MSLHTLQRRLAELLPNEPVLESAATLETSGLLLHEKPRLDPAEVIEGSTVVARQVAGDPEPRFAAFLDGTQTSRVIGYAGGFPIVHGTAAAVIRLRRDRRLITWRPPQMTRKLYAPVELLPRNWRNALVATDLEIVDTLASRPPDSLHPFALQETALQAVQRDRESLERRLGELWCREGDGELFVDGGISDSETVATHPAIVGVVKSHQRLHVEGDALLTVLGLTGGQRTSVLRVTSRRRTPVASWYLRLRDSAGRDLLWALVRIEIAEPQGAGGQGLAHRADEVSRWVLAEALPLAVPDGRWDRMSYGIRDCEEYLRAIQ